MLSFESNNTLSACYGTLGELLLKLRTSFVDEDGDEVVGVVSEDDMEQLSDIFMKLGSKLRGRVVSPP